MPSTPDFPLLRTQIAGVAIADLARQFGTPTYVYDAARIAERIDDLRAFDVIRYAQKACSNLAILDFVRRRGVLVDAVSAWEVRRAMAAGYSPHGNPAPINYTADIFDRESLDLVVEQGIHVNCGSPVMLDQLGERAPGSRVTLRINPGFAGAHISRGLALEHKGEREQARADYEAVLALPANGDQGQRMQDTARYRSVNPL